MYKLHRCPHFVNNKLWSPRELGSTLVLSSSGVVITTNSLPFLSPNFAIWEWEIIILPLIRELSIIFYH